MATMEQRAQEIAQGLARGGSEAERARKMQADIRRNIGPRIDTLVSQAQGATQAPQIQSGGVRAIGEDIIEGAKVGQALVPAGSLGRTDPESMAALRQMAKGLTAPEVQARRDVAVQQIGRQTEGARRALAAVQARAGVRGGVAAAQQAQTVQAGIQARQEFERGLLLTEREERMKGIEAFETARRFDISQAAAERFAALSTGLGIAQIQAGQQASERAAEIARESAQAQASIAASCFAGDTLIKMEDGTEKKIKDIELGEITTGGKVLSKSEHLAGVVYDYKGIMVSGSHAVKEDGTWTRVAYSKYAIPLMNHNVERIYNLETENHLLHAGNEIFSDMYETDTPWVSDQESIDILNGSGNGEIQSIY